MERTTMTMTMTDAAVERPLTLIEKLEKKRDAWFEHEII